MLPNLATTKVHIDAAAAIGTVNVGQVPANLAAVSEKTQSDAVFDPFS